MRNKILIIAILIGILLFISVIFQAAMGIFKIGFWAGIILTLVAVGFIAFKLTGRNKNTGTN